MEFKKLANNTINFGINRIIETIGIVLVIIGLLLLMSLITFSPDDPNFIFPDDTEIKNLLGFNGSYTADFFFQTFGLIALLIPFTLIFSGINIVLNKKIFLIFESIFYSVLYSSFGSLFFSFFYPAAFNLYINGNGGFIGKYLDNYLHKNPKTAEEIQKKIIRAEKERKELSGIRKLARERAKKSNLHNKKLRDCRVHLGDMNKENRLDSTLFITEGDSASGSITKSRNVNTQAVFSLRGKPLNCYSMTKKIVYENEEFNLLQAALNIEESIEYLRYNNIVIATDADVDGMHIRLLLITFFLQFFPELIKEGHLYILQTPLFRVRNKKETIYCYSENERIDAVNKLGSKPEITRFKGLGEISPNEFKHFIGESIKLDPVMLDENFSIDELLSFYMGKNTPDRQKFIIDNLKVELDRIDS